MKMPTWTVPGILGALFGAIAVTIVGFNWGGWTLQHTAAGMAQAQARTELVAAMLPICVEQARLDPNAAETVAAMKDASSFKRDEMLIQTGWATMPGTTGTNRFLVSACVEELLAG